MKSDRGRKPVSTPRPTHLHRSVCPHNTNIESLTWQPKENTEPKRMARFICLFGDQEGSLPWQDFIVLLPSGLLREQLKSQTPSFHWNLFSFSFYVFYLCVNNIHTTANMITSTKMRRGASNPPQQCPGEGQSQGGFVSLPFQMWYLKCKKFLDLELRLAT